MTKNRLHPVVHTGLEKTNPKSNLQDDSLPSQPDVSNLPEKCHSI